MQRKFREEKTEYFEEFTEEGERRVRVVETNTVWFADSDTGTRHNPTVWTETYYL